MDRFVKEMIFWPFDVVLKMFGLSWGRAKYSGFWPRLIAGAIVGSMLVFFVGASPKVVVFAFWGIGSALSILWGVSWGFVPDQLADSSLTFIDLAQDLLTGGILTAFAIALLRS